MVTSLRRLYDVTGNVPNTSLTVPGNVVKRLDRGRERLKKIKGGAPFANARGLSNRTGAERLNTAIP